MKNKNKNFTSPLLFNYIKIALRKISRQKGYSFINITSLAVGLACCTLMMLWIRNEKSFDRFHANYNSIYRVIKETQSSSKTTLDARTPYPLGPAILGKVPEIVNYCRYQGFEYQSLRYGEKTITLSGNLGTADPSIFEMFSFPFVQGDPKTALAEPSSIVITESTAQKLFGNEPPMGKIVSYVGGWGDFQVTGVMKDIPGNSHIQFDCMVPIAYIAPRKDFSDNDWNPLLFYSYVQLASNSGSNIAAPKIASLLNENIPNLNASIILQPLKEVHLKSHFEWDLDNYDQGSQSTLTIFTLAAIAILILAMINFTNLATARSASRAKEVGLRKVNGARRTQIMGQFLGESVVMTLLAMLLALLMVYYALPFFNTLANKQIVLSNLFEPPLILTLLGITLLTGLLSGSYPSFFLSAFKPIMVLKGEVIQGGKSQAVIRKSLVVVQFALTLFLVMGSAVIGRQLKFIREKDLGMNTHNVVNFTGVFRDYNSAKSIFLSNPNVLTITQSDPPQLEQRGVSDVSWEGKNPDDVIEFFPINVDPDYLQTFGVSMSEGRFFSFDFPTDRTESLVLNETAARAMGMNSAIGKRVKIGEQNYNVIGVVNDFHQSSLHRPIEPMIIRANNSNWQICVRINPVNISETIAFLESTTNGITPDRPFRYEFIDDRIDKFYSSERKLESILFLFTSIALFMACLALFGLASYLAEKRTKEISLRKIFGATISGLIRLQSWDFSKWILLSGLIAAVLSYQVVGKWLNGFAYHINPGIGIYLLAILITLLIALLAVGFQTIKAALANPVDALRHE